MDVETLKNTDLDALGVSHLEVLRAKHLEILSGAAKLREALFGTSQEILRRQMAVIDAFKSEIMLMDPVRDAFAGGRQLGALFNSDALRLLETATGSSPNGFCASNALSDALRSDALRHSEALKTYGAGLGLDINQLMPDILQPMRLPETKSESEEDAELFMRGLMNQARALESALEDDEELIMTCWHGQEIFEVLSVTMPSENVVALHCLDGDGNKRKVIGHMAAITFSFMIRKIRAPERPKRQIGFSMPE